VVRGRAHARLGDAVEYAIGSYRNIDVHFPTTDCRTLIFSRYSELTTDQKILVRQLKLDLPPQPSIRITAPERIARLPANAV
jgi:hypothetical protein